MNLADELQKLQALREQGALSEEEFTLAKKRVIDGETAAGNSGTRASSAQGQTEGEGLHRFQRSKSDYWFGGVCGGLADMTTIPSWAWRILFIMTALLHGLGVIMYILLWIFVPRQVDRPAPASHDNAVS